MEVDAPTRVPSPSRHDPTHASNAVRVDIGLIADPTGQIEKTSLRISSTACLTPTESSSPISEFCSPLVASLQSPAMRQKDHSRPFGVSKLTKVYYNFLKRTVWRQVMMSPRSTMGEERLAGLTLMAVHFVGTPSSWMPHRSFSALRRRSLGSCSASRLFLSRQS